jgi:hypothetical protein
LVSVASTLKTTLVPLHASETIGGSKSQTAPQATVLFDGHTSTGGVVSTKVTVWLQVLVVPKESLATQVRVITVGQVPLVTVVKDIE